MGLPKRKTGSGDSIPILKYDARTGVIYKQDRVYRDGKWESEQANVSDDHLFVFDLKGALHGYIRFPKNAAPETKLFPLSEEDIGDPPTPEHREGIRILVRIDGEDIWRECLNTSIAFWRGIDALHDAYLAGLKDHPGQLPLVRLIDTREIKSQSGTAYEPVFQIIDDDWVDPGEVSVPTPTPPKPKAKPAKRDDLDDEIAAIFTRRS
jgi:hypothetical protein